MRITISLIVLLIVAMTACSFVWRNLGAFAASGVLNQVLVLVAGKTALVSIVLLSRIVVKMSATCRVVTGG